METLGKRIKEIRKNNSITQTEFAKRMLVSASYISMVEADKEKPSDIFLKLMSLEFHISLEWIMDGKGNMIEREALYMNKYDETLLQDERTEFTINEERLFEILDLYSFQKNINIYGDQTDKIIEKVTNYIETLSIGSDEKLELCDSLESIESSAGRNAFNIGFKEGVRMFRTLMKL